MFETITVETDERGVAWLTLNRPDKHNALSAAMIAEVTQAATDLAADDGVRVVVLQGAGRSFCAGADLGWMRDQIAADADTRRAGAERLARMLQALNTLPKPLIGRVHGNAFGGGVGMMAVCDIAVAAETARFALTEVKLGLSPATIGPYVLARMGEDKARRVFFSGRLFDAAEAVRLDLIAACIAPEDLDQAIEAEIAPFLQAAPGAVAAAKAQCRAYGLTIDEVRIADSMDRLVAAWQGDEAPEGIAAFFDKRKPRWQA